MATSTPHPLVRILPALIACVPALSLFVLSGEGEWPVFLGRFHPVFLHLPIGILMITALMEAVELVSKGRWTYSTHLSLFLGALSAVAAMSFGILLMKGEAMQGALVEGHFRWGIATAVAAVLALLFRDLGFRLLSRLTLFATCGIMGWASHQGASITHGETYLTDHIPWIEETASDADMALAAALASPVGDYLIYEHLIDPVFEAKCYACHKSTSFKGNLVMDNYDALLRGGDTGPAIVPGDLAASLTLERVHLPIADEEHMPPSKEPQLTEQEIALIEWWVRSGAPTESSLNALKAGPDVIASAKEVATGILENLAHANEAVHEEDHGPTKKEVAEMRQALASAFASVQNQYPGTLQYEDVRSDRMTLRSFTQIWHDEDIQALQGIAAKISEITLPGSSLGAASAAVISGMPELRVLDLRGAQVDDAFLAAFQHGAIQRLNLFGTGITDASLPTLKALSSMETLYLGNTGLSTQAVEQLRLALPDAEIVL